VAKEGGSEELLICKEKFLRCLWSLGEDTEEEGMYKVSHPVELFNFITGMPVHLY
jgi:hypothetical protein